MTIGEADNILKAFDDHAQKLITLNITKHGLDISISVKYLRSTLVDACTLECLKESYAEEQAQKAGAAA